MPENDHALTVDPCDICGDVGYAELIVSCSKCNLNREHCYCLKVVPAKIPKDWLCESCQSKSCATSPCKVNQNCGLQASKRQQTVRTGKVKFLHEDEVIKLSSGNVSGKPIPTSSTLPVTKKAYVGSKNVSRKIPSPTRKSNPCISPTVHGKLPRNEVQKNQLTDHTSHSLPKGENFSPLTVHGKLPRNEVQKNQMTDYTSHSLPKGENFSPSTVHGKLPRNEVQKNQMTDHTSHSLPKGDSFSPSTVHGKLPRNELQQNQMTDHTSHSLPKGENFSPSTVHGKLPRNEVQQNQMTDDTSHSLPKGQPTENRLVSERRICELILDRKTQMLDLHVEKLAKGAPCNAVSARKSIPISGSGAVAECNRSDIKKSNIQIIQENFHHHKKYLPSSICAWRGQFQILQAAASGEFYDGFGALPPCVVNRKAYECSTKMPSVLQLESLPALNVLTDIFGDDSPSLQDIALYFFPSDNNEGSRKNLNSILKFMDAEKSMFRSCIDGVELLVFTSRDLNMDSRDTIAALNEGNFLWGVFRKNKADDDIEKVDMDIDMIGGKDMMGRIDHVLKGKPRSFTHENKVDDDIERSPDLENVDMDIDMIGGKDMMGKIDHVLKGKPRSLTHENKVDDDIERLPDLENADMNIDMIGGKELMGRIDHVLKDKPRSLTQWSLEKTPVLKTTSKKVEENTLATSSLNLCGQDKSVLSEGLKKKFKSEPSFEPFSLKVKKKIKIEPSFDPFSLKSKVSSLLSTCDKVDVPPGFESHGKSFS